MKRTLLLILVCIATMSTWASKAFPGFTTVQQKDGTMLTIQLIGNAEFSYNVTTDGVILFHEGNDYFIAKIDENGEISSTGLLAHEQGQRSAEEIAAINAQDKGAFNNTTTKRMSRRKANVMPTSNPPFFPCTGSPKVLVILAEYQDRKFCDRNCADVFDSYLNADGAPTAAGDSTGNTVRMNIKSVKQYFKDCSRGAFEPQFDVYGPVTLSNNMAYYGANINGSDYYVKDRFVPEVCRLADEAGVDFSQYDSDNDGYADLVYIIYAGYGENIGGNSTNCIWPHVHILPNYNTKYDGKIIYRYGVSNELNINPSFPTGSPRGYINGIGLFCHEFSHAMGLPDIYPSNNMTTAALTCNQNMDWYDLMDGGEYGDMGYTPVSYLAWERERCGWMQVEELTQPANITMQTLDAGGKAYKIVNDANRKEYLMMENFKHIGSRIFSGQAPPGHGMLVYRINEDKLTTGYVNSKALDPAVAIVAADSLFMPDWFYKQGTTVSETSYTINDYTGALNIDPILVQKYKNSTIQYDSSTGTGNGKAIYNKEAAGDPWPGTSNVTEMTGDSYYAFSTVKTFMQDKPVTEIKEEDGVITFKFMGGDVDGIINIDANDNTIDNRIADKKVYTIDGRLAGTSLEGLRPGIYIQNNKKIVVK
ncbi:MAG: M6 family metalloprotease domain-containing protein [Prevotella sp.]|nr:M6 family metalloprotease domain-containing protein [Prevotella sp.]